MKRTLNILMLLSVVACGDSDKKKPEGPVPETNKGEKNKLALSENICRILSDDIANFEISCPEPIKLIEYDSISSGRSLDLGITINGKKVQLLIEKMNDHTVHGWSKTSNIDIKLVMVNGKEDKILIP